jgi:hypothetical protein
MPRILVSMVLALTGVSAVSSAAMAQATGLDREHRTSGLIEFGHPFLQPFDNPTASTGVLLLAARHAFGSSFAAVVDMPISHYGWEETGEIIAGRDSFGIPDSFAIATREVSGTGVGNYYLGVEFFTEGSPLVVEAGVRTGFDPDFRRSFVGLATDLALWDAFASATTFRTGFRTHTDLSRPLSWRVRGALSAMTGEFDDQIHIDGGVTGMQKIGAWVLAPALDARFNLNNVEDQVVAQVEVAAERPMPHARPGLFARFYMNSDWHDVVTWTLGLRCAGF